MEPRNYSGGTYVESQGPHSEYQGEQQAPVGQCNSKPMLPMTFREALEFRLSKLREKANDIEELLKYLPAELPYRANNLLVNFIVFSPQS